MTETANVEIESQMLDLLADPESAMTLYREGIDEAMLLRDERHATKVLAFVRKFIDDHHVPPTLVVLSDHFNQITFEPPEIPVAYLIDLLRERYARNVIQDIMDTVERAALHEGSVYATRLALRELSKLELKVSEPSPAIYVKDWKQNHEEYLERVKAGKLSGCTIGFSDIDDRLGGLKNLCFLAGRLGQFKTWHLLVAFLENLRQGVRPVFITLEMSKEEIYDRLCCLMADASAFRRANYGWTPADEEKWRAVMEDMGDVLEAANASIYYPSYDQRTIPGMMEIIQKENADIAFIDQYSFVRSHRELTNMTDHQKHHLRCADLKDASQTTPLYIACQFNREAASLKEMGEAHQIADTDAIPRFADLVMGVYQNKDMRQSSPSMVEYGSIKARSAGYGSWYMGVEMYHGCRVHLIEEKKK